MGKIVKYCTKCEEGFAEKFGFCPNCGEHLQAFEMNPLQEETATKTVAAETEAFAPASFETVPQAVEQSVPPTVDFSDDDVLELDSVDVPDEQETLIAANIPTETNGNGNGYQPETASYNFSYEEKDNVDIDGDYRPTVIEAKDVQLRNGLLAGFGTLIITAVMIAWVWSLFVHALPVFALDEPDFFAFVGPIEDTPTTIEEIQKKNNEEGGGGGGGGKDNPDPVSKGRLPNQVDRPIMPPQPMPQVTNASLPNPQETQGTNKRERTNETVGLTDGLSTDTFSSGSGSGGGIGNGRGTGAGNGIGTGEGNGIGSGSGNGNGNGNGNGTGNGDDGPGIVKNEKPVNAGVTSQIKILSKPQARYTDEGRKNNIQGSVTLKVTFSANGTIGSISTVSGLPYGLTEKAIEAARQIRFEPAKKNGVPYSSIRTITYSFTIY
jgi:TonB family protein